MMASPVDVGTRDSISNEPVRGKEKYMYRYICVGTAIFPLEVLRSAAEDKCCVYELVILQLDKFIKALLRAYPGDDML